MNPIHLLAITISLSVPIGPEPVVLDINPTFSVPVNTAWYGAAATTLPGVVLYNQRYSNGMSAYLGRPYNLFDRIEEGGRSLLHHELTHVDQQHAMGPLFWVGYAGTLGTGLEPYNMLDLSWHGWENAYRPEPEMTRDFPLFRLTFDRSSDSLTVAVMPGYPQVYSNVTSTPEPTITLAPDTSWANTSYALPISDYAPVAVIASN